MSESKQAAMRSQKEAGQRVALVFPPFEDKRDRSAYYVAPPLGLLYIAAELESAGHIVSVHDFVYDIKAGLLPTDGSIYDACAEKILRDAPSIVGFGTQCSTNPGSVNIASRIKKARPDVTIVFGGHDVSFLSAEFLNAFPFIDFVLAGEAEYSFGNLVTALRGEGTFSEVPGLAFRSGEGVCTGRPATVPANLDALAPPSYHLVPPLSDYFRLSRIPTILIDSGRGCPFECDFCQTSLLSGHAVRYRSIPSLIAELSQYRSIYGAFEAYFVHDLFTAKRSYVEQLCHALIESGLNLTWQCRCRLDQVDKTLLSLMKSAGCRMLLYGVESGAEETLVVMNKRYRKGVAGEIRQRVTWTVDAGIFPSLSMVIGMPEENRVALNATMVLASDFLKIGNVNSFIQLTSPLPGTALAARVQDRLVYRGSDAPTAFSQGIEFADGRRLPEDETLIESYPKLFSSFYVVPPSHGDLDLCVDISVGYCKLLEVYCWSYCALADRLRMTHLELFESYRQYFARKRTSPYLVGLRDSELWDAFRELFDLHTGTEGAVQSPDLELSETYRFERQIHDLAVSAPLEPFAGSICGDQPFALQSCVRFFRTEVDLPLLSRFSSDDGAHDAAAYLLFMTRDRLRITPLTETLAEALDLLHELSQLPGEAPALYRTLHKALTPILEFGVIAPLDKAIEKPLLHQGFSDVVDRTPF